ncbi:hypothetical protein [Kushneria sp. TE3]|uniref:hypothetical protein n=1 Tax=Kushneria sp. TE3 TaxID=3449832 RepID=UPI003F685239
MFRRTGRRLPERLSGCCLKVLGIVVLAASLTCAAAGSEAMASDIVVEMTGTPDTRFSARWEITRADGGRRVITEQGRLPTRRHFQGVALMAELIVLDDGALWLEVHKGGSRSRASIGGKESRISISVE